MRLSLTGHSDVLPESPSESREKKLMSLQNKQAAHTEGGQCARRGRCYLNVTDGCEQRRRKVTRRKWGAGGGSDTSLWGQTKWVGSCVGWLLRSREQWCPKERRVLGKSIRGNSWDWVKNSDLSKFLSRWGAGGASKEDRRDDEKQGMGTGYTSLQLILEHLCKKLPYSSLEMAAFQGNIKRFL